MNKKIIKYPDSVLRNKSEPVSEITEEIKKLGQDMVETMVAAQGIGLSAPQVGELKRVIVVQTEKGPKVFINPQIIKKSKEMDLGEEGCLSFPKLFLKIKRPKEVEIKAMDGDGRKIKAEGLLARILQHEIDHLDGILFIDRISLWQKFKLKLLKKRYVFNR